MEAIKMKTPFAVVLVIFLLCVSAGICGEVWNIKTLHTAKDADYLSDLKKNIILEMNKVRTNPALYAKTVIAEIRKYYEGNLLEFPDGIAIQTQEGVKAVDECYEALLKSKPVSLLKPSKGLSLAARDHVKDQSASGNMGHEGSDGSTPKIRILRYGKFSTLWGENIDYGNNDAQRVALSLLIDDGVPSRGHRENILREKFKVVGVACGTHPTYQYMCVMDFAGGFTDKNEKKQSGK